MSTNQFVNPFIHDHCQDTMSYCSDCLAYLIESIDSLKTEETTVWAKQGLCNILECIQQAIDFEGDRADIMGTTRLERPLDGFERKLVLHMCQQLHDADDDSGVIIVPNQDGKPRNKH